MNPFHDDDASIRVGPPDILETATAVGSLNTETAPGIDKVAAEVLKLPENLDAVHAIMLRVWKDSAVPGELVAFEQAGARPNE